MKSKARFLPFVLALALLTSLFVLSSASAATGTVKLSKNFITAPDGVLEITVEDEDLNFGVVQSGETMGQDPRGTAALAPYMIPAGPIARNEAVRFRTQKAPIKSSSDADLYPDNDDASGTDANIGEDYRDVILRVAVPDVTNSTTTVAIMNAWNSLTSASRRSASVPGDRHPFALENPQGGAFILRSATDVVVPEGGIAFTVTYKAPDVQETSVQISSTQDSRGIRVALRETGADTGQFKRSFQTADITTHLYMRDDGYVDVRTTEDDDADVIPVGAAVGYLDDDENAQSVDSIGIAAIAGSLITVAYDDGGTRRVANATVETTNPTILVIAPTHETATRVRSARLIAEVTDADSGIDEDTISFNVDATNLAGGSVAGDGVITTDVTIVTIAGGLRAEVQLSGVPAGETQIKWSVSVSDEAGNMTVSDRDPDDGEIDDENTVEPDLYEIRIDTVAPDLGTVSIDFDGDGDAQNKTVDGAITGNHLNDDKEAVTDATKGDNTSVRFVFNEPLDEGSLQESDFRVNGIAPADVAWSENHPESVFLRVPTLAADARPLVELTGDISDTAGNVRPGGKKVENASDGISPTLDVAVSPLYHKEEVTIDIRTDEALLTVPTVTLNGNDEGDTAATGLSVVRLVATDHYRATFKAADAPMVFNVQVNGKDTSANPAGIGKAMAGADDAIEFEIDKQLPAPTSVTFPGIAAGDTSFDTDKPNKITTLNPFITIEWDSEASEYGRISTVTGEGDDELTATVLSNDKSDDGDIAAANADGDDNVSFKDLDTHGAVDVTDLVIGGHEVNTPSGDDIGARTDVTTDDGDTIVFNVTKPTENRLLISIRGLALGKYEVTFNGADELGNALEKDVKLAFEVKEPDPFEIKLTPGWNLVSLPAEPQASGINDVIGADHAASIVLTYDPTQGGAWLSASRGEDGMLGGSLENISARTAYWIFTDSFDSLKVSVQRQSGGAPQNLPTVNLVAGWNLLPVLDVSGGKKFGDDVDAGGYVDNVQRTYSYNTSSDRFNQIGDGVLEIGHGYWAYLSKATVLVP